MNITKKTWLIILIVVLVVGGAVFFYMSSSNGDNSPTEQTQSQQAASPVKAVFNEDGTIVSHDGVMGEIALDTLKSLTDVRTQSSDFGEFVTGIGEVDADSANNFWGFYVNDGMATVGAGDYLTEEGDQIEWRLTELN